MFIFHLPFNDIGLTDNEIDKTDAIESIDVKLKKGSNNSNKMNSSESEQNRINNPQNGPINHNENIKNSNNIWNNNGKNNGTTSDGESESEEKIDDNLLFHTIDNFEGDLTTMGIIFDALLDAMQVVQQRELVHFLVQQWVCI